MATLFYRSIEVVRIDAGGVRIILPGATIDLDNITQSISYGSVVTDNDGNIPSGSVSGDEGDVLQFSSGSYAGLLNCYLNPSQTDVFTDPRNAACFVVEDLSTATISKTVEIHLTDDDDDTATPIMVGAVTPGLRQSFLLQSNVPKRFTARPVAIDTNGKRTGHDLNLITGSSFTIPAAGGTRLLADRYEDAQTTSTAGDNTLYVDNIPAGSFYNNGDVVELEYSGIYAANGNTKTLKIEFDAPSIFTSTVTTNGGSWSIQVSIIRVSPTDARVRTIYEDSTTRQIGYTTLTSLDFTADIGVDLIGNTPTATTDLTAKFGYIKLFKAADPDALTDEAGLTLYAESGTEVLTA